MKPVYKIMFFVSVALTLASILVVLFYGLNFGVDFRGGSIVEVEFKINKPELADIKKVFGNTDFNLNNFGEKGLIIKTKELSETEHQELVGKLTNAYGQENVEEKRFESVGPIIGQELKRKSITAIGMVLLAIVLYIAFVFRKLARTLPPWAMGVSALIALAHDVFIPLGVFAVLGKFYGIEITAIFVAAILTILGYSVSDTVVVFDRIRENVTKGSKESFPDTVHKSVMQTLTRSLNTTMTTLLSLLAIYFFGGESIKYFSLMLIIGIFSGAYSSIFVASPLLIWLRK